MAVQSEEHIMMAKEFLLRVKMNSKTIRKKNIDKLFRKKIQVKLME